MHTRPNIRPTILLIVFACASTAHAQTRGGGPEIGDDVQRAESMKENDDGSGTETKTDRPPKRPGIKQFDDVTVERKRPDALPPAQRTELPAVLRGRANKLPKPPSAKQLEATEGRVRARVYELVATQIPKAPGETTTLLHRGHAVLVSQGDKADTPPILISTYFWLKDIEELYLVPKDADIPSADGTSRRHEVERRSLSEVTVSGEGEGWLNKYRDELVEAKLYEPDEHRNLVTVVPQPVDALDLPDDGLALFDLENTSPTRLYGYSPQDPNGFRQTRLLASNPKDEALVYYLQTAYPAVFGAPIVSTDGRLLVLTAFRHPKDPEKTLVIPPEPIAAYLEDVLDNL